MSNELKPCPFCGGKDLEKEVIDGIEGMIYRVSCPHCANTMPMTVDTSMEEAIRIWNTRPAEDALKAELEDLLYFLRFVAEYVACNSMPGLAYRIDEEIKKHEQKGNKNER